MVFYARAPNLSTQPQKSDYEIHVIVDYFTILVGLIMLMHFACF